MTQSAAVPLSVTEKRILGCLYGQATGDAMGMPSELWPKSRVRQHFGWIDTFLPGPEENIAANEFVAGEFTDDTSQCVALMDAIIEEHGAVVPQTIARHIMAWATRIQAFEKNILGPTSKAALNAIHQGIPLDKIEANGVTNGSAMRVAPVGCLMPSYNTERFIEQVRLSCLPTHKSDIAIAGAVVIARAVSLAVEGTDWSAIKQAVIPLADSVQRRFESTFSPLLGRRIMYALNVVRGRTDEEQALTDLYEIVGAGMDNIESIPCAIALADLANTNPVRCAVLAANLGGDTDTIGAMATAICGAIHGIDSFDADSIALINHTNNIDFTPYARRLAQFRQEYAATNRMMS
ncbi:ADP-ribosylglycohydrolase family protein [Morganella morganii]|nr:ADP-ribosylglycohydrolase family protein [Morganella morganii]HAE78508.1 ADP-ribosylglycohydrolase family protein [Morganella sp. (in: enterobacteria)]EKU5841807.1 ADP-ribosylglycohydrolase family protein [Morganella morganii]MBA5807546.1 ADP-ribosylglycohydrolase family protein [Morganella morganii]QXO46012.1 ADP-ribosylglycohydrolase family protein [Morganella morganii]QXO49693.1 ADP-ribosylglycohydrolase family protein [Morganella morganii]